jgi:hypothetical protein
LLPNLLRKVHFWMHDWCVVFCRLCRFPFKQVQQWPSVPWQGLLIVLVTMIVYIAKKSDHFCSQIHREKSIFECTIGHAALCQLCHFPFKWVQQWPSMPMARIACCFSTNEFLLEIHMVSGVMLVKGYSMRQQFAIWWQD